MQNQSDRRQNQSQTNNTYLKKLGQELRVEAAAIIDGKKRPVNCNDFLDECRNYVIYICNYGFFYYKFFRCRTTFLFFN